MLLSLMIFSGSAMAQEKQPDGKSSRAMSPRRVRLTQEHMNEKMVRDLKLDENQAKKVTKLNKKFKTLIEGEQQENMKGQRPLMGQGRPDGNRGGGRPGGGFGGDCFDYLIIQYTSFHTQWCEQRSQETVGQHQARDQYAISRHPPAIHFRVLSVPHTDQIQFPRALAENRQRI